MATTRTPNTAKMAAGKALRLASIVWELRIGGLQIRCFRERAGVYVAQAKTTSGWNHDVARGPDAAALWSRIVSGLNVTRAVQLALSHACDSTGIPGIDWSEVEP